MSPKRVRLKDIAERIGVSIGTVSRALSDHPDISRETKARVQEAAHLLNYVPNYRARYLRAKHSRLIALIVPELNTFFTPSLVTGINAVARSNDYSLIVFQSEDSLLQERRLLEDCTRLSVDGVMLALSSETSDLAHVDVLTDCGIPVVLLDNTIRTSQHATVTIDDEQVGADAARYLIERGHERAVGIFSGLRQPISELRRRGFIAAFASEGLDIDPDGLVEIKLLDELQKRLERALAAQPEPTAVFAMSDELLVRVHHYLSERSVDIPREMSLLAISDGQAPYFLHPNVTHFRHSGGTVGERAAHTLIGLMQHASDSGISVQIGTRIVELGSVAPPA